MKLGFNQFSDLSLEEFTKQFTGRLLLSDNQLNSLVTPDKTTANNIANLVKKLPTPQPLRIGVSITLTPAPKASTNNPTDIGIFDWRKFGKISSVKDQNGCGSCYAFSSVAALESLLLMLNPSKYSTVNLSEQQIVDCSSNYGNYGCKGGLELYVYQYTEDFPVASENQYPYKSKDQACQTNSISNIGSLRTSSFVFKTRQTAAQLREAVKIQPVSIGVCAGTDLQFYESGIISSACCRQNNHAVLLIGWGRQPVIQALILLIRQLTDYFVKIKRSYWMQCTSSFMNINDQKDWLRELSGSYIGYK
ncbi:papain family cysteine protease containing protein [Stylonychia lemnae]|uniref:Papain family cysteine protease containing protein n=1 Tax=Stylonychia lemnae TaxID=5949 RepID=A0A078A761_STYLE|nr:papain family cysteine protease containing protein [Stylonychia lemnae]|eukprot:CDW76631.1 papain family cysteine protease containing protein [Stylonychia lemnae]